MSYQTPVILEPSVKHQASVIWLHGLGADGHDFEPIVPHLGVASLGIKFIFPHAKVQPVTINAGMAMRSWYDILGMELDTRADSAGIKSSVEYVNQLIENEIVSGIDSRNIVLAGFSQGGVVCLHAGLTCQHQLAGLIALSTYLPLVDELEPKLSEVNKNIHILQAHGTQDPVVHPSLGDMLVHQLKQWDYNVLPHKYPMQHAVCPEEIAVIGQWLQTMLVPV